MSIESILIMIGFGVLIGISVFTFWRVEQFIDKHSKQKKNQI